MRIWLVAAAVWAVSCGSGPQQPAPLPAPVKTKPASPADRRPVIVAFGDSLTAGPGVEPDQNYPAVLQQKLDAAGHRYRVVNLGVSGDTTGGGLARLYDVLALKPRIAIVELGANDGLRGMPVEATRANLEQIVQGLQQAGVRVILAGMTLPPNYGAAYVSAFEKVFVDLARQYKTARIPFFLEGVAAVPTLLLSDGLHPNAAGHQIVAGNVLKVLEPLL